MSDQNQIWGHSDGPLTFPPLSRRWIILQMMSWAYLAYRCTQKRRSQARNKASLMSATSRMFKVIFFLRNKQDTSWYAPKHYLSGNRMTYLQYLSCDSLLGTWATSKAGSVIHGNMGKECYDSKQNMSFKVLTFKRCNLSEVARHKLFSFLRKYDGVFFSSENKLFLFNYNHTSPATCITLIKGKGHSERATDADKWSMIFFKRICLHALFTAQVSSEHNCRCFKLRFLIKAGNKWCNSFEK